MEAITVAEATAVDATTKNLINGKNESQKRNRIQVSNTKKPLFFYLNLAKRYIKQHNDVELSALGMAIPTVVTISEILKSNGLAIEKKVLTSTVGSKDDSKGRLVQKAKIEIVLGKTENFDNLMTTAATAPKKAADKKESDREVSESSISEAPKKSADEKESDREVSESSISEAPKKAADEKQNHKEYDKEVSQSSISAD